MKLYLIRHGESAANFEKRFSFFEEPITQKGIDQAKKVGEYLKGIHFDKVYSSDMERAIATARIALPGKEPEQDPMLREIATGDLAGKPIDACLDQYGLSLRRDRLIRDFTSYGGENEQAVMARSRVFLAKMEEHADETVAAFTHGGFICATLEALFGVNIVTSRTLLCDNGMVAVFECSDACWKLHSWNANGMNR